MTREFFAAVEAHSGVLVGEQARFRERSLWRGCSLPGNGEHILGVIRVDPSEIVPLELAAVVQLTHGYGPAVAREARNVGWHGFAGDDAAADVAA